MEIHQDQKNRQLIPLFPLGVVLLPGMTMPLHIFEERYKSMVNECLERNEPFGIVYFDGKQMHKVGCTALIVEILNQYEDGRMDIMVMGQKRFFVDQTDDTNPYLVSGIFYIGDVEESISREDDALFRKAKDLLKHLNQFSGQNEDDEPFDHASLQRMSFLVPSAEGFTKEERQKFLEMTSARERLEKGLKVLEKVIAREKLRREVTEIIGGNGQVRAFLAEREWKV